MVAKWLGHSNTHTIKQYYVHILDNFEKEQMQELNNYFDANF
ncbi:MAG: hypothetical protein PHV79_01735 [Clostridia bacterium]|jgi:integrase|nr:hypothetical protein [Clostridia bacterium]MDD3862563.1 hypothetical protein [Clostridia bacterium]MDD4409009.1 hypothetical protein [Clostridia bacterium]